MGPPPEARVNRVRADQVYVDRKGAAALAGVSLERLLAWIGTGEISGVHLPREGRAGRCRVVYRLDQVLAVAKAKRS